MKNTEIFYSYGFFVGLLQIQETNSLAQISAN